MMPGITNPAEEYFKDGLWAWDPAGGVWKKLIIDPLTDRLIISIPGETEVVQAAPNDLRVGIYGWNGAVWHQQPMLWGYSDRWVQGKNSLVGAAGTRYLDFDAVSDGEVWVLLVITSRNMNTDPSVVKFQIIAGGVTVMMEAVTGPGVAVFATWKGHVVLKKDDYVQVRIEDCALDDDVYAEVLGYKMKIAV